MKNPDKLLMLTAGLLLSFSAVAEKFDGTLDWAMGSAHSFMVTGEVDQVNVRPGERISKGARMVQLYQRPFQLAVKKYKAGTETIEPLLFDAKIDLSQAEELYDRTVLSQIELQKVEAKYRGLDAQSRMQQADYELARMKLEKSTLVAPYDALVVDNQFVIGQMISEENQSAVAVILARTGYMAVNFEVTPQQVAVVKPGAAITVEVGSSRFNGTVTQVKLLARTTGGYQVRAEFSHAADQHFYPGQTATVSLQ